MQSLSKPTQSRINRLAHRRAIEFEKRIKSNLTEQLLKARTEGASLDEMTALIEKLEASQHAG